jgi:lipopolysaccharide export system protein LptA
MRLFFNKIFKAPVVSTGSFCMMILIVISFSAVAQKTTKIEILNANTLEFEERDGENVKRLIGDVRLKHDDALMFCDSAYIYSANNTMDAYGNVRINQGDSLRMFGDSLKYNGNTKVAVLRGDIRLINNDVTLTTNFLDYNRTDNVAYYYGGGKMVNQKENNTLTSEQGYYYSNGEAFYFKENVVLVNPEYTIEADTLNYNSASEIVNFLGPTTIKSKDNFIYTERGWYNTVSDKSKFYENAYLYSEQKQIEGDTLYYDRQLGFGEIICNGTITDTVENIILKGDVAHLFELKDSAMITQEALLMQLFDDDTLYMHADTFKISSLFVPRDSVLSDTINASLGDTVRNLFAYNHVKFYKKDMQGKADSVVYNFSDSTINFYDDPVIWSLENQITADFIYLVMAKGDIDKMYMNDRAFIISKVDSISDRFNQIKGKNMIGQFADNELRKINVFQNSETIYYPIDDDGKYIGVNRLSGSNMLVLLKAKEIETITFIKSPEGELSPLKDVSEKDTILKGFNWRNEERPADMFDVFVH